MRKIDITALARSNVRMAKPYSSARDDFDGLASVFMDANESPFPAAYNRYPDPHQRKLKTAIASLKHVERQQIFLGNGSDEAIDLLLRVFCEPGVDQVIIPQPTYGMYAVCAAINDVEVIPVLLTENFDLDSGVVLSAVTSRTKMIFLCSPNNPSGNLLGAAEIENILSGFQGLVVIDEAYIDFTESPGWLSRLSVHENLCVLQTFSKAWGLAGLRLGMFFANSAIIDLLNKIKPPYNVNTVTQAEALKSIYSLRAEKDIHVTEILKERKRLGGHLEALSVVRRVYPSEANFLLVQVRDVNRTYEQLVGKGIIVRNRSNVVRCDNCLRITVGAAAENDQLIHAMSSL